MLPPVTEDNTGVNGPRSYRIHFLRFSSDYRLRLHQAVIGLHPHAAMCYDELANEPNKDIGGHMLFSTLAKAGTKSKTALFVYLKMQASLNITAYGPSFMEGFMLHYLLHTTKYNCKLY